MSDYSKCSFISYFDAAKLDLTVSGMNLLSGGRVCKIEDADGHIRAHDKQTDSNSDSDHFSYTSESETARKHMIFQRMFHPDMMDSDDYEFINQCHSGTNPGTSGHDEHSHGHDKHSHGHDKHGHGHGKHDGLLHANEISNYSFTDCPLTNAMSGISMKEIEPMIGPVDENANAIEIIDLTDEQGASDNDEGALMQIDRVVDLREEENDQLVCMMTERDVVNLTSSILPFAKLNVYDAIDAPATSACTLLTLLDSGSSCCLLSQKWYDKSGMKAEIMTSHLKATSFTGNKISISGSLKLYIDFGTNLKKEIVFLLYSADSNFEALIGYDYFSLINLTIHPSSNSFKVDGIVHPLFRHEKRSQINSLDTRGMNLAPIPLTLMKGMTFIKNDMAYISLMADLSKGATADSGDLIYIDFPREYEEKGLRPTDRVLELYKMKVRKGDLGTKLMVHLAPDAPVDMLNLPEGGSFGQARVLLPPEMKEAAMATDNPIAHPVLFVEDEDQARDLRKRQREVHENMKEFFENATPEQIAERLGHKVSNDLRCIIFYLRRRVLSDKERKEYELNKANRISFWTIQKIREKFKETIEEVDERFREDVVNLLYQRRLSPHGEPDHIKIGCITFALDALYPTDLNIFVKSRPISGLKLLIHQKMQKLSLDSNIAEPATSGPHVIHHYLIVNKPQDKYKLPTDKQTLDQMSDEALEACYRQVIDVSSLVGLSWRTPYPDPPTIFNSLGRLECSQLRSLLDVKRAFYQVPLSQRARKLFAFETSLVGAPLCWLQRVPMGASESSRANEKVMSYSSERQNCIPANTPFPKFCEIYDQMEKEELKKVPFERGALRESEGEGEPATSHGRGKESLTKAGKGREPKRERNEPKNPEEMIGEGEKMMREAESLELKDESAADDVRKAIRSVYPVEKKDEKCLYYGTSLYVDDIAILSPQNMDRLKELNITEASLFRRGLGNSISLPLELLKPRSLLHGKGQYIDLFQQSKNIVSVKDTHISRI